MQRTFADIDKAQRELGYIPATGFDEGLQRFADWLRAELRDEAAGSA